MPSTLRNLLLAGLAVAGTAVSAAPAAAAPRVGVPAGCDNGATSKPFAPWRDYADYFRLPGGDFEAAAPAGWSLDGATVAPGGQAFGGGAQSLSLPAGAAAVSPAVCVTVQHPTSRFFVRRAGAAAGSVRVDAITRTATGGRVEVTVGTVDAGAVWAPSPLLVNAVNVLPAPATSGTLSLRLTAVGGPVRVDDVYVDPFGRG